LNRSPQLLVSVRDAEEAFAAVTGGADIIDVKEPAHGSLGRAAAQTIDTIGTRLEAAGYAGPLSAALGELREFPEISTVEFPSRRLTWLKVGLSGMASAWRAHWTALRNRIADCSPAGLIAVVYADWKHCGAPPPTEIVEFAISQGAPGILFDTFEKRGTTLLDHISRGELEELLPQIQTAGRFVALAGSIGRLQLHDLIELRPDILAVRSAVCRGGRQGRVDAALVADFRSDMQRQISPIAPASVEA
jgi:uncharacterized protein (UPF0264 family)